MFPHRIVLVALATLFFAATTSLASACCGAPAGYGYGCGGCAGPAPVVYERPSYTGWGCGGCGRYGHYHHGWATATYIEPSPIYVVNLGPSYDGPGVMVPFGTWSPDAAWGYGHRHYPYIHRHYYARW